VSRTFADKLARLMLETTKGETRESGLPAETVGEVVESVASMLGKFIALQCGGHQESMSVLLDVATQYMHETAADTQKAGQFLADPANWFTVSADGTVRTPVAEKKVSYTDRHWYNQEIARAGVRLLMERPAKKINGVEMLSGKYDPEMIGMVAASLSEQLGVRVATEQFY